MAQQGSKAVKDGVQVIQGTPTVPITAPTLFLRLWRVGEGKQARTRATLFMVRPGLTDYVIKELIPDMELDAQAAARESDRDREARRCRRRLSECRSRAHPEGAQRRDRLVASRR
jgi:hypothetical protein